MSWICPICERELKKTNQWHYCIKVSVNELLKGQSDEMVLAFDKILAEVSNWEGVTVSCSKNFVVFVHKQTFFLVRPIKNYLELKFYSAKLPEEKGITKSIARTRRYENYFRLTSLDDLTPKIFTLIHGSYTLL